MELQTKRKRGNAEAEAEGEERGTSERFDSVTNSRSRRRGGGCTVLFDLSKESLKKLRAFGLAGRAPRSLPATTIGAGLPLALFLCLFHSERARGPHLPFSLPSSVSAPLPICGQVLSARGGGNKGGREERKDRHRPTCHFYRRRARSSCAVALFSFAMSH